MQLKDYAVGQVDFDLEGFVSFELRKGDETVLCSTEGKKKTEQFDCHPAGVSVEWAVTKDFAYLEVTKKKVEIIESSVDVQDLELTEVQLKELNAVLNERMEVV
jgi:diketogulonate reductase-like aldo/keto reductase